ncbi:hypothetical protein L0128_05665 [candidate division KSB1 bacterium]|nr:hypothetical protein [candidate division KSB1 bacterium]
MTTAIPGSPTNTFSITRAVFITQTTEEFGKYTLRGNNLFTVGDDLSLYLEPRGCTLKKYRTGYKARLIAHAIIESVTNPGLTQNVELGLLEFAVPDLKTPLYANITLQEVGKLPLDLYKVSYILTDQASQQQVQFSKHFRIGPSYLEAVLVPSDTMPAFEVPSPHPVFSRTGSSIYCHYKTRRIPPQSYLKAVWIAESTENYPPDAVLETYSTEVTRLSEGYFYKADSAKTWSPGNYRVELYLNDEFEICLFFQITTP